MRLRLPVGQHPVFAVVDDGYDKSGLQRRVALGTATVQPGMVSVVAGRIWR